MDPSPFRGYRILGEVGRGAMGVVHRAYDEARGEVVALKTLLHADPGLLYRLKKEFRTLRDLSFENVVQLHDLVVEGDRCFFTMEYLEGEDFLTHVRRDPRHLRPALVGLARGLQAIHAAGLLHRDVKPTNVIVTPGGRVV